MGPKLANLMTTKLAGTDNIKLVDKSGFVMVLRFAICLAFFIASLAQGATKIQNHGPEFLKYWAEVKRLKIAPSDLASHVKLFKKHVIKGREQFYLDVVFDKRETGQSLDDALQEALAESIPIFSKYEKRIAENAKSFEKRVATQLSRLKSKLPDFRADIPIFGMVSLNKFAGGVRMHGVQQVLAISYDKIEALEREFAMVFAHEIFHVYHNQISLNLRQDLKTSDDLLIAGSFIEGLATFAEGELNPQTKNKRMGKELVDWCDKRLYRPLISQFLKDNKVLSIREFEKTKHIYRRWFYTARKEDFPFPTEAGYCIGDQVVTELSKKHSLHDMAKWPLKKALAESKTVLTEWKKETPGR